MSDTTVQAGLAQMAPIQAIVERQQRAAPLPSAMPWVEATNPESANQKPRWRHRFFLQALPQAGLNYPFGASKRFEPRNLS